ncbi:MAG TPA: UdgX family uracil-DNA binding protein [Solirubrobacteraceae bacterium]|jgi:DNA polymerase|nr:UdgX family uracil-DNA binding protein [Solirubrobacteraceae bacterium]
MSTSAGTSSARAAPLERLREEAASCHACPLWKDATQTVFGEGPLDAEIMLVGEQPGDQEDKQGHPFVGPAGRVLDQALTMAEIDRSSVFATNAVKHFKYRMRGKRRIHQRPSVGELVACRKWLQGEVALLAPEVLVALGATAAHALMGRATPIGENRGHLLESPLFEPPVLVTAHPSSVLREREHERRSEALQALAADLRLAVAA